MLPLELIDCPEFSRFLLKQRKNRIPGLNNIIVDEDFLGLEIRSLNKVYQCEESLLEKVQGYWLV